MRGAIKGKDDDTRSGRGIAPSSIKEPAEVAGADRLEELLEQKVFIFEAIFRLFEKLSGEDDLEKVLKVFLMTLSGQLSLERTAIYLSCPGSNAFRLADSLGAGSAALPSALCGATPFAGYLLKTGGASRISDYTKDPSFRQDDTAGVLETLQRSGFDYASPVAGNEDYTGILFFSGKVDGSSFNRFDEEFLYMLVRVAALSVRNASLRDRAELFRKRTIEFSRVKKELMLSNSHELRTPLSVLKSSLWSIESEDAGSGILVDMARDAVTRMESKLDQLLSLCDIEMEEPSLALENTDISSLVEECLRGFIPELEEKGITVRMDDRLGGMEIYADPGKVRIVIGNIVDNAIRAVERGGNIHVSLHRCEAGPEKEDGTELMNWSPFPDDLQSGGRAAESEYGYPVPDSISRETGFLRTVDHSCVVIRISDDGRGIPGGEIETLSLPFRKCSNAEDTGSDRPGVGLTVAQNIIAGHGGRLLCRSNGQKGAQFSIWLPAVF